MLPPPAPSGNPWPGWPAGRLVAVILLLAAADVMTQLLVYDLTGDLFLPVLAGSLLGVVVPCALLARREGGTLARDFHLDRRDPGTVLAAVVTGAAALVPTSVLAGVSSQIHPVDPQWIAFTRERLPSSAAGIALAAASAVVVAPLAEELLFRGLVYRLARRTWGCWPAAVVSSLLFGLVHGEPWFLFGLIALGLVLAFLYELSGSLLAPVLAHAVHNAISLTLLLRDPAEVGGELELGPADVVLLGVSLVALVVVGTALARRGRRP